MRGNLEEKLVRNLTRFVTPQELDGPTEARDTLVQGESTSDACQGPYLQRNDLSVGKYPQSLSGNILNRCRETAVYLPSSRSPFSTTR
jgi:2-C-methyl-D-erythritol 4-phosphate cytidylyltransferase